MGFIQGEERLLQILLKEVTALSEKLQIIKDTECGHHTVVVTKKGDCDTARHCDRDRPALQLLEDLKEGPPDESLVYQLLIQLQPRVTRRGEPTRVRTLKTSELIQLYYMYIDAIMSAIKTEGRYTD